MIYTHIAAALIGATVAGGAAWQVQTWRTNSHEKDHIAQHAAEEFNLHALEQKRSADALAAVAVRSADALAAVAVSRASETKLRTESAANRDALVGLRASSAAALHYASTDLEACTVAAATYDQLFTASTERYSELAEKADRHGIDLQVQLASP